MNTILRRRAIQGIPEDNIPILEKYLAFEPILDALFIFSGGDLLYSIDEGKTWETLTANTATPTINSGDKIYFKGEITPSSSGTNKFSSVGSKKFNIMGNILSLLYKDKAHNKTLLPEYAFYSLFQYSKVVSAKYLILPATTSRWCFADMFLSCTSLTEAPELPATELADHCYRDMFWGCISLVAAPNIIATTLGKLCCGMMFDSCSNLTLAPVLSCTEMAEECYNQMFANCTRLVVPPELPATTLALKCYNGMFRNCTSLITPPELPSTTLEVTCYGDMFNGCTSLTTAPALPATTLAQECYYNMFASCTLLTVAPELPATTLSMNCYEGMFLSCSSLIQAPILRAIDLLQNSYRYMFQNCSSLNYIKAMFTTTPGNRYTYNWVSGVAATGTFVKNSAANWSSTGNNGIPTGWTVETASE